MKTKFAHRRYINPNTGLIDGKGGATIAYREIGNNQIEFAIAKCHENDNFCKQIGRIKSEGRLQSHKSRQVFSGSIPQFKELAYTMPLYNAGNT